MLVELIKDTPSYNRIIISISQKEILQCDEIKITERDDIINIDTPDYTLDNEGMIFESSISNGIRLYTI